MVTAYLYALLVSQTDPICRPASLFSAGAALRALGPHALACFGQTDKIERRRKHGGGNSVAASTAMQPAGRCLVQIGAPDALVGGVEGGVEEHAGDGLDHAREERAHLQQPDLAGLPPPRLTAGNGPERPAGGRGTSARAAPGRNGLPLPGSTALHACAALWQGGNWAFLAPCRKDGRTGWAPALHGLLDAGRNAVAFEANHWRGAL